MTQKVDEFGNMFDTDDPADDDTTLAMSMAKNLRVLAEFLDAHPDFPVTMFQSPIIGTCQTVEELKEYSKKLAPCKREAWGECIRFTRTFGPGVRLQLEILKEKVCTRRLKERVWVPPAEEGFYRETYEYDCEGL